MPQKFHFKWLEAYRTKVAMQRSAAGLQRLDNRMLKDIGLTRSDVGYPAVRISRQSW
ncbi:MAG: DUF1127 domain-containing protein [Rhodobacteraceae bacterium]|nr:DUF1127 domain-containing protein [Paracoccaceae bacterium]